MVANQLGEGVDAVGAESGVDVFGEELAVARPVLRPVGVVTYDTSAVSCVQWNVEGSLQQAHFHRN